MPEKNKGGRPRKSLEYHLLAGNVQPSRHLPAADRPKPTEVRDWWARFKRIQAGKEQAERDYVGEAISYAEQAVADEFHVKHGRLLKAAARRFLHDLKWAGQPDAPFRFDPAEAVKACAFIECLKHVEGKWDTERIVLHPAQLFFVVQLFGFRRPDGSRRFTSALFATGRKSGKSTIAAGILLYCQCCEDEPGAQVISAATTYPQASIIFAIAKQMVDVDAGLRKAFDLQTFAKAVVRVDEHSSFKPIHAKASTQDGLNPSHVGLDEIHAHKTADLLNVLTSAAGARRNPLWLYTTTEGYSNPGPWTELRQFAKQLLGGIFANAAEHFLIVYFAVDDDDQEFDEAKWIKSNPLIDANPHLLKAIQKEAIEAKQMPSKMAEFRIKRLNRPSAASAGWVDLLKWQACGGVVDLEALRNVPCTGGLDLASTRDMCVFRLVWKVDGRYFTWGQRWVPQDAVKQRTVRGTVPYASWVEQGLVTQTPGDVTDYGFIEGAVLAACARFKISGIAYDPWNATDLVNRLVEQSVPMVQFIQGPKSYHPAMQELERAYISGRLNHGGDPVLTWCASNIVVRKDVNLNMAPDRQNAAEKIDDFCALAMAIGLTIAAKEPEAKFQLYAA